MGWILNNGRCIREWADQNNGNNGNGGKSGIFARLSGNIVDNLGGWIDSIGQTIVGVTAARNPQPEEDNTPKVLAIAGVGVAAVVLIVALLIIFKN